MTATDIMQKALDHSAERTAKLRAEYKAKGSDFYGIAAGWAETAIGTVTVCMVEAGSRIRLQRHATRKTWYLNGKRIARDTLIEKLAAA